MLATACFLLIAAVAGRGPYPICQPATYRSPDGHLALDVDPSLRQGAGTGTYSMHRDGQLIWEGARPWTLWQAVVTDGGFVGGYAYTGGIDRAEGDLLMLLLDPRGDIRVEDRIRREGAHVIDGGPIPTASGIVHLADAERLIFRVDDYTAAGELWIGYQLPDCHEVFRKRPTAQLANGDALIYRPITRCVWGAPLFVAEWERYEYNPKRTGAYFALYDADANPVWQLSRPADWQAGKEYDDLETKMRAGVGLLDVSEPLHFALWAPASHERLEFEVKSTGTSTWKVVDLSRTPQDEPITFEPGSAEPLIQSELEEVGAVQLDTTADAKSGTPELQRVSAANIDALGRVLIQDKKSGAVFVFDSNGKRMFVGVPSPADVGRTILLDRMSATREGGVIVPHGKNEVIVLGAHGEALGVRGELPRDFSVDTARGIGAGTRYLNGWELYDDNWKLAKHIERRPNGRWLQSLSQPAWGPDGTLGFVEHGERRPGGPFVHELLLYTRDGEMKKIIPLPDGIESHTVVLSTSSAVLFSWSPECVVVHLRNGAATRCTLTHADKKSQWTWGFTANGKELLGLEWERELLHRFVLY